MSPAERKKKAYTARTQSKAQTVAVRRYLAHLREVGDVDAGPTVEELTEQLAAVKMEIDASPSVIRELDLHQQRLDLEAAIAHRQRSSTRLTDIEVLEEDFVREAPGYAARKGVTRQAWLAMGVPVAVLEEAGL